MTNHRGRLTADMGRPLPPDREQTFRQEGLLEIKRACDKNIQTPQEEITILHSVEINKGQPRVKRRREALKGALSHQALLPSLLCASGREEAGALPQEEEGRFSPGPATAQPMRNRHHPQLSLSSNGDRKTFKAAPPNFPPPPPPPSSKPPLRCCRTCLWFAIACGSRNAIPLPLPSKLMLLVR